MKNKVKIISIFLSIFFLMTINIVRAAEVLPDDAAYVSSVQIIQTKTGTGPWDDNDEPGNDSSEDNGIVRSFDQVTWTVENTMALKEGSSNSYVGGEINFEATLPDELDSKQAKWDTASMSWITNAKLSSDGKTLTGKYKLTQEKITIPGKQTLVFVVKLYGVKNGTTFKPTIKTWLNGNDEKYYATVIPDEVKVSAAPRYNVKITQNGNLQIKTTLNYGNGDTKGRIYGYGIALQLYNTSVSKGLRGIEYATGDITFDIDMKLERTLFGSAQREDITSECTPVLWNYKANAVTNSGNISGRTMYFGNSYHRYEPALPLGVRVNERRYSVYNSGKINVVQEGSKLKFTISDYDFDGTFPIWSYSYGQTTERTINYTDNIGNFSVAYMQVFVPDNDASTISSRNYYLTLSDNNFKATSVSGATTTTQMNTSDDANTLQHVLYKPGYYNHNVWPVKPGTANPIGHSTNSMGDAYGTLGQKIDVLTKFNMSVSADDNVYSATRLIKYDADAYEPIYYSDGTKYRLSAFAGTMKFDIYYVTKKDGTNWVSQDEMNSADILDLNVYKTIEEIPEGAVCVGTYCESTADPDGYISRFTGDNNCLYVPLRIKQSATIGKTYAIVPRTKLWINYVDRDEYNILNNTSYPKVTWDSGVRKYIKTEYDENGKMKSGTHSGGISYGATMLIVAGNVTVQKYAIDENGNRKTNYDISQNDTEVKYKVVPSITKDANITTDITNITLKITDTLPVGMHYVANSANYGEPEIINNSDGTETLIWYKYDCTAGKEIEPLTYTAHISEDVENGKQLTSTVVVLADADKVGITNEKNRTATETIQIINLASHRLYKSTSKAIVEENEQIKYSISYKNNTDSAVSNFQLLDILPYNGDSRGTSYTGTYKVEKIVVTQLDSSGNSISNDNLVMSYSSDENSRTTVTSKDENLGDNWTKFSSNATLQQYITAFCIKGKIDGQVALNVDIYLSPSNNNGLDKYVNSATAQVYKETDEMTTGNVVVQVVKREIEGIAWYDENNNGIMDDGESVASGVAVNLVDDAQNSVTDVKGNVVGTIFTDQNGYYSFDNLPAKDYFVKIDIPSSKYTLTTKLVGSNSQKNSKFNIDSKETDEITKLNSIDLPNLVVSNVNAGFVKKETKVITKYIDIDTKEEIYDEDTQTGRVDDNYTTQNELDNINKKYSNIYEYVKVTGKPSGTMEEDTLYITYYYRKIMGNITITKVDEADNTKYVSGAKFKIEKLKDDGTVDTTFTSKEYSTNTSGIVKFENLLVGKYKMTETLAPKGYELLKEPINVEITKDSREINLTLKERSSLVMPLTGGKNWIIVTCILGGSVIFISLVINKRIEKIKT